MTCRGGLTMWDEYLIVGCYNIEAESDEVCYLFFGILGLFVG